MLINMELVLTFNNYNIWHIV